MTSTNTNRNRATDDTWSEYRRLVLAELERLDAAITKLSSANFEYERGLDQVVAECKEELIERSQKLKDAIENRHYELLNEMKRELETKEKQDVESLRGQIKELESQCNKISIEVKVIKAKAALFGFLAGLGIAAASLVARIVLDN